MSSLFGPLRLSCPSHQLETATIFVVLVVPNALVQEHSQPWCSLVGSPKGCWDFVVVIQQYRCGHC